MLTYLEGVGIGKTALEISAETGIKLKTVQNTLTKLRGETPCMVNVEGAGTKSDPRRFRARSPRLEQGIAATATAMVPPDSPPYGPPVGGNQIWIIGEPGDDRWTW
jgi:hypothetical protein